MYDIARMLRSWSSVLHFINDCTCFGGKEWLNVQDMNGKREVKKSGYIGPGNVGKPVALDSLGSFVL
jgi:hypothetical protein